jgi:hypothetical protein
MKGHNQMDRHPDPVIDATIDKLAHDAIRKMTPCDLGLMLYPNATPVSLSQVPPHVIADHLNRYTQSDLESGQFLEVLPGKYTFIMGHETKQRKESEQRPATDLKNRASHGFPSG